MTRVMQPTAQRSTSVNNDNIIEAMETIELEITSATQRKFKFPDIPNLRNAKVVGIETHEYNGVPFSSNSRQVVDANIVAQSHMTLTVTGREQISRIPLYTLLSNKNFGIVKGFARLQIDWPKSFIEIAQNVILTPGQVLLFNVYYKL